MKLVLQRVLAARVSAEGREISSIGKGLIVFSGIKKGDTADDARGLAFKTAGLRVFEDESGKMNLNLKQAGGQVLSIPQFTLLGKTDRGNRPGFEEAAPAEEALPLWEGFNEAMRSRGVEVREGEFGARMLIELTHYGPVTLLLESGERTGSAG